MNIDGTKTMYAFDFPVKYVDDNGNIQDIRLEIADSTVNAGEFETAANDTVTTFSAQFTDGIALEGNDTEIRLIPILPLTDLSMTTMSTTNIATPTATAQRIDADTVAYPYDAKTTVEYSLTYTGFKEDIVVSEYTGQTTYPFRLLTNGLALEEIDGSFFLVDDQGNIEASIGDIIIFTADERNNAFGNIEPKTIVENQEYLLNIVVDADYLADPATAYPIRIDPTIEIKYSNNGEGAVEDITISTNTNFSGSHTSLYVGRRSTEGIARALMRFPGLNLSGLAGATVTSATVRVRDLMCESNELSISCHVFTGNVWDDNSATWANVSPNSYVSTPLSTNTMSWSIGNALPSQYWYTFDITAAVQGWIDGNYSQNRGIIFKAASSVENGSAVNNRTFGSYNRSSYRPSLSVTYSIPNSTVSVREGATSTLSAAGTTGTVTWASSNTGVATVSTAGVVTGVKAGHTTMTASVNGVVEKTFNVYVAIDDGVYYIKNNNSGYYLSVKDSAISNGSDATQESKRTASPTRFSQLWKITYLSNGKYSIRPMHRLNMGLDVSGTTVDIWSATEVDNISSVPSYCQWTITYSSSGYVFRQGGSTSATMVPSGLSAAVNTTISVGTPSTLTSAYIWTLENVTSSIKNYIIFYDAINKELTLDPVRYITPRETKTCAGLQLYASFVSRYTNSQSITWSASNAAAVTLNQSTGTVTGVAPSDFTTITASATYNGTVYSETYGLYVTAFSNGIYYLKNKGTEKYADIYGQTIANGTIIHQRDLHGGDSPKWILTHQGDGTYTIRTANAFSNIYMGISGNSTTNGANVVLRTGTIENGMIWNIQQTVNSAYKLIPKSGENTNLVLTVNESTTSGNGAPLQQQHYVNDTNYKDEWLLYKSEETYLVAHNDTDGAIRNYYFAETKEYFETISSNTLSYVTTLFAYSWSKDAMIEHLQSCDVFFIHAHGKQTGFKIGPDNYLEMQDITGEDLSNLQLALLLTCNTGQGYSDANIANNTPNNIVEQMVLCGAETVVGFNVITYSDDCNKFAEEFAYEVIFNGRTVEEAINEIDYSDGYILNMAEFAVVAGNKNNRLREA